MKIKVFNDNTTEKVVRLKLRASEFTEGVELVVVNENGERIDGSCVLVISEDGMLHLCEGLSSNLGLQTDDTNAGAIVVGERQ